MTPFLLKNKRIKFNEDKDMVLNNENIKGDPVKEKLKDLTNLSKNDFNELKRRGFCKIDNVKVYLIKKSESFYEDVESEYITLTSELLLNQNVDSLSFKKYNFNTTGNLPLCGSLHPLLKVKNEIKNILLQMGFHEMATNKYVESSFWNFDALFQPQNHPARDSHDTFFVLNPNAIKLDKKFEEYQQRVKETHEKGHNMEWDINESEKTILRTHTTAVSARYLYALMNNISDSRFLQDLENLKAGKSFEPIRLFSIDKVFRNETVDATHLAEFHQVEGFIAGYNLTLGDLIGVLTEFYKKFGINKIKVKPAYNPYTEPSMEVFGYHEGLRKWIEIANSGIFRPEMLEPMGYPKDVTVIAWGLSVERPTMIKYGLNNIRELVGHKVDIDFIRNSELVFLEK